MTSSPCNDVTSDQQMRQPMSMMMAYQDSVYSVLPPVGARLRHDDTTSGEGDVTFLLHTYCILDMICLPLGGFAGRELAVTAVVTSSKLVGPG